MSVGKLMVGDDRPKLYCGNHKVLRAYAGDVKIYSAGSVVTYVVQGSTYQQEYDDGQDVLHPTVVDPILPGASFLGWSTSPDDASTLDSLTMDGSPVTLYAVIKYNDDDVTHTLGQYAKQFVNAPDVIDLTANVYGSSILVDCAKYQTAELTNAAGIVWTDHRGDIVTVYAKIGQNMVELGKAVNAWTNPDSHEVQVSFTGTRTIELNPDDGVVPFTIRIAVTSGYYGGNSGGFNLGAGSTLTLKGRIAIG